MVVLGTIVLLILQFSSSFVLNWRRQFSKLGSLCATLDSDIEATAGAIRGTEIIDVEFDSHKPLGCTVEESLVEVDGIMHVFVSKVVPGGNAEKAGVMAGDVIAAVSGLFGELENICGEGLEKVKGFVTGCPEDEKLSVRVIRGSSVIDEHEKAIVELCEDPTLDGKEADASILAYLETGRLNSLDTNGDETDTASELSEEERIVASMYNMWASDFQEMIPSIEEESADLPEPTQTTKPWSSRSSPSGTFVRDPQTGEMKNID